MFTDVVLSHEHEDGSEIFANEVSGKIATLHLQGLAMEIQGSAARPYRLEESLRVQVRVKLSNPDVPSVVAVPCVEATLTG